MSSVAVDKHERSELDFVTGSGVSTDMELTTSSLVVTSAIFAKSLLSSQSCEANNYKISLVSSVWHLHMI
jgi:hypothetical protein